MTLTGDIPGVDDHIHLLGCHLFCDKGGRVLGVGDTHVCIGQHGKGVGGGGIPHDLGGREELGGGGATPGLLPINAVVVVLARHQPLHGGHVQHGGLSIAHRVAARVRWQGSVLEDASSGPTGIPKAHHGGICGGEEDGRRNDLERMSVTLHCKSGQKGGKSARTSFRSGRIGSCPGNSHLTAISGLGEGEADLVLLAGVSGGSLRRGKGKGGNKGSDTHYYGGDLGIFN
jgi:hypothetical protein